MKMKVKTPLLLSLLVVSSAVQSDEWDDLLATSAAIVNQVDTGIAFVGGMANAGYTGVGISAGQLSGNYYISTAQVNSYNASLKMMVNYMPYGNVEAMLEQQAADALQEMEQAIDQFTDVVVDMLEVVEVNELAENASDPDSQAEVQEYIATNDLSVSQEDADSYNSSLDAIEASASAAGAYLATAANPEAVAYLMQNAQDQNTTVEQNSLAYSSANQAIEMTWLTSGDVSSVYLNGQGSFGLDIYSSEAAILATGYDSMFYNTGPTSMSLSCFLEQVGCEEGDDT
jgi:hypothetical protein